MNGRTEAAARLDDPENWTGGFYELDIELGPPDPARLQHALTALWAAAGVDGCHSDPRGGGELVDVPLTVGSLERHGHLTGVLAVPGGRRVVCGVVAIDYKEGAQWLSLHVPLGALGRVDRRVGGFPFGARSGVASLEWRLALDEWLAGVAEEVHREVGIACALAGFEVDAGLDAARLAEEGVPAQRWVTIMLPGPAGLVANSANC